jgi:copper chaperone NosL
MSPFIDKFYAFLDRPLYGWSRLVLLAMVVPLVLAFTQPLWRISMTAPQYPDGLYMEIYTHKIDGGNKGQHIKEINTLNHYIGMHKIDRAELSDLDWIPFGLGLLMILTLRCAAIGNVRALIDLAVLAGYIGVFAMGRFVYKMYVFGHNLDPDAPIRLEPFTPAIFGTKKIANFSTQSYPQLGSVFIGFFFAGVLGVLGWHLFTGRKQAARELAKQATSASDSPPIPQ